MFDGEQRIALHTVGGIGPHLAVRGKSHSFLELRQEPGVYSLVTPGLALQNLCLFSDVRTLV